MYEQAEAMEHPTEMDAAPVETETPPQNEEETDLTAGGDNEAATMAAPDDLAAEAAPQSPAADPSPAETDSELEALRRELKLLRQELDQRRAAVDRLDAEYAEFSTLYPEARLDELSDEVWNDVRRGVPIAAAVALWEKKKQVSARLAAEKSAENRRRSAGSVANGAAAYLSPDEVRAMSPTEVRENYQTILKSMQKWK